MKRRVRSLREIEHKRRGRSKSWIPYILVGLILLMILTLLSYRAMRGLFILEDVVVKGNHIIEAEEVKRLAGLRERTSLLDISTKGIYHRLLTSPWIKEAVVRKELPDRIIIWIEEAAPQALIKRDGRLFLVDETGTILEELSKKVPVILPVLDIDYRDKELIREALLLLKTMKEMNITPGDSTLYLTGSRKEDLTVILARDRVIGGSEGGEVPEVKKESPEGSERIYIKVGYGQYAEKLQRLIEFAPHIREKGVRPAVIDLRFGDRVIVRDRTDG